MNDIQEVSGSESKIESTSVDSEAQGSSGDIGHTEESVKSAPEETAETVNQDAHETVEISKQDAHDLSETGEKGGEEVQTEPVKEGVESSRKTAEEGDKKGESEKSAEKKVIKLFFQIS